MLTFLLGAVAGLAVGLIVGGVALVWAWNARLRVGYGAGFTAGDAGGFARGFQSGRVVGQQEGRAEQRNATRVIGPRHASPMEFPRRPVMVQPPIARGDDRPTQPMRRVDDTQVIPSQRDQTAVIPRVDGDAR